MVSVAEAEALIAKALPARRVEERALADAAGLALAEDYLAREDSPRFTNSAMDGFAARFEDVTGEIERQIEQQGEGLSITGAIAAGDAVASLLAPQSVVRIATGAPVPENADMIIPIEDCAVEGGAVRITALNLKRGQYIRARGEEYKAGEPLLRKGTVCTPPRLGLAAQNGIARLRVFAPPRVALLSTGNEIVSVGSPLGEAQTRNANIPLLKAALAAVVPCQPIIPVLERHARDGYDETREALAACAREADIIISTGGVSVGAMDWIKKAAEDEGFETVLWRVRQKPGKPMYVARKTHSGETSGESFGQAQYRQTGKREVLLFGLPGNPVSTLITFTRYARPALRFLCGLDAGEETREAVIGRELANMQGRAEFVRVRLERRDGEALPVAVPLAKQDSFMLTSLADADGFIFLEEGARLAAGERALVTLL
jgi:molybdopterin molybdotransferase